MDYVAPELLAQAFNCPLCGVYAHMHWEWACHYDHTRLEYMTVRCSHCEKSAMWRITETTSDGFSVTAESGEMLYPDSGNAPLPHPAMPPDVAVDYHEAVGVFGRSPRAAAALLRLALQRLCVHLGQSGKNIHDDIRALATSNALPPLVIKVADTVRLVGNNAVHPGEMSDKDVDYIAGKMFYLINFIVAKAIAEPAELQALYEMTPATKREAAESSDAKTQQASV